MLSEEQKEAIMETTEFGMAAEMLAVSLLQYRLKFLKGGLQKYTADSFTIETEKAGRSLKIKWKFKPDASGFYLWGFRDTGGFSNDQWSEDKNGARVIDAYTEGETVEVLQEGVAYFYTFFLKPFKETQYTNRKSPLRFQITIETKAETDAIEAMLEKAEQVKKADRSRENMSQAVKELGLVMEFDEAVDDMEKSLIERIKKKNLPKDEEEEKVEFVRDAARLQRDKYQP